MTTTLRRIFRRPRSRPWQPGDCSRLARRGWDEVVGPILTEGGMPDTTHLGRHDLDLMFGGLRGMSKLPDALVIVDPRQEKGAVDEAKQLNIPVVALLNSDCDRSSIAYPIPGNDASVATITFTLDHLAQTYADNLAPAPAAPAQA